MMLDLVMRDLLAQTVLIDEIQTCTICESGMLNIKKSCSKCHSIDIKSQKFIHCFSCGKIGAVSELLREDHLVCLLCKTKLHELGVDYGKPKEDKLCNDCGHCFSEAEMQVVCLVCHHHSPLSDLTSRRLYDYTLTQRGESLVRGIEKSIYRNFSHFFKVIDYPEFMSIAHWQMKLAERYPAMRFSLMTLQITNAAELIEKQGKVNSERLMGQFFTSLRQIYRESDLSSRLDDIMYFLLPMANQDGCLVIVKRITETVQELAREDFGKDLTVGLSYMTSAEIIEGSFHSDLMIAELQTRMIESNVYIIGAR